MPSGGSLTDGSRPPAAPRQRWHGVRSGERTDGSSAPPCYQPTGPMAASPSGHPTTNLGSITWPAAGEGRRVVHLLPPTNQGGRFGKRPDVHLLPGVVGRRAIITDPTPACPGSPHPTPASIPATKTTGPRPQLRDWVGGAKIGRAPEIPRARPRRNLSCIRMETRKRQGRLLASLSKPLLS
jgi:hypothetical protein